MLKKTFLIFCIIILGVLKISASANDTVNFSVKDADIRDILRALGQQTGLNIIALPEVEGKFTINLTGVKAEDALNAIVKFGGFDWRKKENIYEIYKLKPKTKSIPDKTEKEPEDINIKFENDLLTIKAIDVDAIKFFVELSQKTGFSFIPDENVKGKITVALNDIAYKTAVDNIITGSGYGYLLDKGVYKIYKEFEKKSTPPKLNIEIGGDSISIEVVSADIGDILQEISKQLQLDMIFYGSIKGKIEKMKFTALQVNDALNKIVEGSKFGISNSNGIYKVSALNDENSAVLINRIKYYKLQNLKVDEAVKLLPSYIKNDKIKIFPEHNSFVYEGYDNIIERLDEYVNTIDKPAPSVMIEAQIIDFSEDLSRNNNLSVVLKGGGNNMAITPGNISSDIKVVTFNEINKEFSATLQALISEGKAEVKATPKIATISGKEAVINVALEEHFKVTTGNVETPLSSIQKISSGIQLKIKPQLSDNSEYIRVEIFLKVSSPGSLSSDGIPAVNTRDAKTELLVKDGQTIVIAGLIQNRDSQSEDKFPVLGNIPIIKNLFSKKVKSNSKSELVFYITPKIIK